MQFTHFVNLAGTIKEIHTGVYISPVFSCQVTYTDVCIPTYIQHKCQCNLFLQCTAVFVFVL